MVTRGEDLALLDGMGWGQKTFCFFALLLLIQRAGAADGTVGVVYGYEGDNLPLPSQVVQLLNNNGVTQVRIYDTNSDVLKALVGSSIEVIVGIPNDQLATVGASNVSATTWVVDNIVPYSTSVNITAIGVGSEVLTSFPSFTSSLVQTMVWIHDALIANQLDSQISVSSPFSTDVLQNSFPPSQAYFNATFAPVMQPFLQFLALTGSFLMLNVDTFNVYQSNSQAVNLNYALFEPGVPTLDNYANLQYYSLFDALVDAGYAAMAALNFSNVKIVVTETGWPSQGDSNENGANSTNAQTYNGNLVRHVHNDSGTPAKPLIPITAYVYELFNENRKSGPTSARNYGLFEYNLNPVYNVDLTGQGRALTGNGTQYQTWCVAKAAVSQQGLQAALDWACGQGGVNCSPTKTGGPCFLPDTLQNHASWAFNAYYQQNGNAAGSCDFRGVAQIVSFNPSYGSCTFQASNLTTTIGPTPTGDSVQTLQFHTGMTFGCLFVLFVLNCRYLVG